MDTLLGRGTPPERIGSHRLERLSRELRTASAEYRSLALHAGPMHRLALDAKQRVEDVDAMLHAEAERLRSGAVPPSC